MKKKMITYWSTLHCYSRFSIKLGVILMLFMYITALSAKLAAPHFDYLYLLSVYKGGLEAAPALFAAGTCAGLIGDLMLRSRDGSSIDKDPPHQ